MGPERQHEASQTGMRLQLTLVRDSLEVVGGNISQFCRYVLGVVVAASQFCIRAGRQVIMEVRQALKPTHISSEEVLCI